MPTASNFGATEKQAANREIINFEDKNILNSKADIYHRSKELYNPDSSCFDDEFVKKQYRCTTTYPENYSGKPHSGGTKKVLDESEMSRLDQIRSWVVKSNRLDAQRGHYKQSNNAWNERYNRPKVSNNYKCDKLLNISGVLDLSFQNMSSSLLPHPCNHAESLVTKSTVHFKSSYEGIEAKERESSIVETSNLN